MQALLQRLSAPPTQTLRTREPAPYTASYTVSTRPVARTIPAKIVSHVGVLLRFLVGLAAALLLWLTSRVELGKAEYILLRVLGRLHTDQLFLLVDQCQWKYLGPCMLAIFILVFRRNYTGT
jgi:phosphatidylinositol glycan class H protein